MNPYFVALCVMFAGLWLAGSASRADVLGQVVIRGLACVLLAALALIGNKPSFASFRPVLFFLAAAIGIVLLQLVPLPPAVWQMLPGHSILGEAAGLQALPQPWRPLSVTPSAGWNAAASLIVPLAVLIFLGGLSHEERQNVVGLLLGLIVANTLVGLVQFAGAGFSNAFSNRTAGDISGMFANRNHFALMLAIGCMVAPVWAFDEPKKVSWRVPLAIGFVALFVVSIIGSGSRAGLALAAAALLIAVVLVRVPAARALRHQPKWVLPALLGAAAVGVGILTLISLAAGRAVSIERLMTVDPGQDMRQRAFPTLIEMVQYYAPWGAGFGSFDTVFRMHEPYALLKPSYFNHAHNDFLEVAIDAGLPGVALLGAALIWWFWASAVAWRATRAGSVTPKLGSGILLLLIGSSAIDYPLRTPIMMAVAVVAGTWLASAGRADAKGLPRTAAHL